MVLHQHMNTTEPAQRQTKSLSHGVPPIPGIHGTLESDTAHEDQLTCKKLWKKQDNSSD